MKAPLIFALLLAFTSLLRAQTSFGGDICGESNDWAGFSVSMPSHNVIAVGSANYPPDTWPHSHGKVTVYELTGGAWVAKGSPIIGNSTLEQFGRTVVMPDENTLAVGTYRASSSGAEQVAVYRWDGSNWQRKGTAFVQGPLQGGFGHSISMPDSNTLVVGAGRSSTSGGPYDHGAAWVYEWSDTMWVQKGTTLVGESGHFQLGAAVDMPTANTLAVGAPMASGGGVARGVVRIMDWDGVQWVQRGGDILGKADHDSIGTYLSMPDENTVAIGSLTSGLGSTPFTGSVAVFTWTGSEWQQRGLDVPGLFSGAFAGYSVSMPDANTFAVGAVPVDGISKSYVKVYDWSGSNWSLRAHVAGDLITDLFGYALCMPDDKTLAVGAGWSSLCGSSAGLARVYDIPALSSVAVPVVSPNPCTNYLLYQWSEPGELMLSDQLGRILLTQPHLGGSTMVTLPNLAQGTYILSCTSSDKALKVVVL